MPNLLLAVPNLGIRWRNWPYKGDDVIVAPGLIVLLRIGFPMLQLLEPMSASLVASAFAVALVMALCSKLCAARPIVTAFEAAALASRAFRQEESLSACRFDHATCIGLQERFNAGL